MNFSSMLSHQLPSSQKLRWVATVPKFPNIRCDECLIFGDQGCAEKVAAVNQNRRDDGHIVWNFDIITDLIFILSVEDDDTLAIKLTLIPVARNGQAAGTMYNALITVQGPLMFHQALTVDNKHTREGSDERIVDNVSSFAVGSFAGRYFAKDIAMEKLLECVSVSGTIQYTIELFLIPCCRLCLLTCITLGCCQITESEILICYRAFPILEEFSDFRQDVSNWLLRRVLSKSHSLFEGSDKLLRWLGPISLIGFRVGVFGSRRRNFSQWHRSIQPPDHIVELRGEVLFTMLIADMTATLNI